MTTQGLTQSRRARGRFWLLGIVLLAPLGMGARDCEQATVGADCTDEANADNPGCVCEYDGKFYAEGDSIKATDGCNQCGCQKDGEVVCTQIACASDAGPGGGGAGESCGGLTGAGCDSGLYCKYAPAAQCGAADQTGTCQTKSEACTLNYVPVCGCDDKTYGNACAAARNGISVATQGECSGGSGGQDAGPGDGCDYDGTHYEVGANFPATDGCNTCTCGDGGSVGCTKIGCSGGGDSCGGLLGGSCEPGEFCNFPIDAICGAADATGTCERVPDACDLVLKPVCGCDGEDYGNACEANMHNTSVASEGECGGGGDGCDYNGMHYEPGDTFRDSDDCNNCTCSADGSVQCTLIACEPGKTCGGLAGVQCDSDEYCNFPPSAMCGAADQTGTCEPVPDSCITQVVPVCGCDGEDYSHACVAAMKGVSVLHTGECE